VPLIDDAPTLIGERVTLRPLVPDDTAAVAAILAAPEVAAWWPGYDADRVRREYTDPEPGHDDDDGLAFAITLMNGGAVVGIIQCYEETDEEYRHAGIDIAVDPAHRGQGLGPDAIRTLARWLFDVRGHHRLVIDPAAANVAAIRSYAKVGFRPVGTMRQYERGADGTWHDGLLMDLLRDELG
jgi:aminoglycoside 6'-N-acetyltransferase